MQDAIAGLFAILLLACLVGIVVPLGKFLPFAQGLGRKHYAIGAVVSFVLFGIIVPEPTPEEKAARAAEAAAEEAAEAKDGHEAILAKAAPALEFVMPYTRKEFPETYSWVGKETFEKLDELEPAAIYVAAESNSCTQVNSGAVSDVSKKGKAVWFVDCENGNRFMVKQAQAEEALERFKAGKLTESNLEPSCTQSNIAMCKATPEQRAAADKEIEYVSFCDLILEQVLVSPGSLDLHHWKYSMGKDNLMVVERPFDSQNSFGAMIRNKYRCEIDAAKEEIESFTISGPMGTQQVI